MDHDAQQQLQLAIERLHQRIGLPAAGAFRRPTPVKTTTVHNNHATCPAEVLTLTQELLDVSGGQHRRANRGQRLEEAQPAVAFTLPKAETGNVMTAEQEEEIYRDSGLFLKGNLADTPQNDYCQHFVNTGVRPQNFIREGEMDLLFNGQPHLTRLRALKNELLKLRYTTPMYQHADLRTFDLNSLGSYFDVIYVDAPLEEYETRAPGMPMAEKPWSWDELTRLPIERLASKPGFLFLWVGDSVGLNRGREVMRSWGFRRIEDICWVKTNKKQTKPSSTTTLTSLLQPTKEHCLVGLAGKIDRRIDSALFHSNVNVDVIVSEEPPVGNNDKPAQIFEIMEHFCQGRRRLHLFGSDKTIRNGWVTVGMGVTGSNYNKETFQSWFNHPAPLTIGDKPNIHAPRDTDVVLGSWSEIEELRPKSPPPGERDREFEERTIDTMVRQLEREAGPRATHHQQPAGPPPAAQLTGQAHGRPEMRMEDHESQPWVQNQAMPVESSSKVWQRLQYQPPESGEGALEADSGLVTSQNERERDDYRRGQDSVRGSRGRGRPFYPHGHERGQGRARPARWVQVVDTDFQPYESPEPSDAAVTFASHEGGARGRGWKPRGRGRGGPGQANLPGQHFHNGRARGGGRGGRGGGGQYMAEQHSDT